MQSVTKARPEGLDGDRVAGVIGIVEGRGGEGFRGGSRGQGSTRRWVTVTTHAFSRMRDRELSSIWEPEKIL